VITSTSPFATAWYISDESMLRRFAKARPYAARSARHSARWKNS
jgi:hypothetical protein